MPRFDRTMFAIGLTSLGTIAGSANATWSILIADTRTGEIVIGSATCVELIDLQQSTPVIISGVGAVTAQSAVDTSGMNRQLIRDRLLQGVPLDAILEELSTRDAGHNNRQYGMIDVLGDTLTYSGIQNAAWAGGQTGRIDRGVPGTQDDIVYAVQGNILSGGNVVQAAVDAILASDGDLPAMLMEAMQAAKLAGGDGRCSCSGADPTGCGSPPPGPFKSADVGYMLGTRANDIDAIRAIYPIEGVVGALETIDTDGDGYEEVIVGNRDTNELSIFRNTSSAGVPLSSLDLIGTIEAPASGIVAMGAGDFDNDGHQELAIAFADPAQVMIYETDTNNGLAPDPAVLDLLGVPTDLAVAPLFIPGEDLAVSIESEPGMQFFGFEDGAYQYWGKLNLGFTPGGIEIDELIDGHRDDLAVTDPVGNTVHVYEHGGELGFKFPVIIPTIANPIELRLADMDNDGDNEILVLCGTGRAIQIFNFENDAWTQWASIAIGGVGIGMDVGDMNGDGFPDVISTVQATNRNLRLWISDGQGGFTMQTRTRVGQSARSVVLTDMNNNGDLDIVVGHAGDEALVVLDNPRGGDLPQPGWFAAGEYFMTLNVPNQRRGDEDPVDQLQDLYDTWRMTREGRVDAVRSSVIGRRVYTHSQISTLTIELRDLQGNLLNITDPAMVELETPGELVTLGEVINLDPGVFIVDVTTGDQSGHGTIIVSAGAENDRVRLMPDHAFNVTISPADFDGDGVCTFYDVARYIAAYQIQHPDADINFDTMVNFHDISSFLQFYNACAGG